MSRNAHIFKAFSPFSHLLTLFVDTNGKALPPPLLKSAQFTAQLCHASSPHVEGPKNVIQSLIAICLKLKRSVVLRANIIYEVNREACTIFMFPAEVASSFPCVDGGQRKGIRKS
jgi:hypothetical protein